MRYLFLIILSLVGIQMPAQLMGHWESRTPMPEARTNLSAASLQIGDTAWIYVIMGLDSTKACGNPRLEGWKYNTVSDRWDTIAPVPDTEGRIAASATSWNGKVYLMGGYKVFTNCNEYTSPRVDIYDPLSNTWSQGDSMAVRVDDHGQMIWRDSLIFTVSGWSQNTNTRAAQHYNPAQDTWTASTIIAGPGLFGHAAAIVGDTIIYLDGVRISGNFVLTNAVWKGVINPADPTQITWSSLGTHPGAAVYRGGGFSYGDYAIFTGGTSNAYNIDGIGYNGTPSVESGRTFGYHLPTGTWEEYPHNPDSVMDVRQVVQVGQNHYYVIGGMEANQKVSRKVSVFVVDTVLVHAPEPDLGIRIQIGPNPCVGDELNIQLQLTAPTQVRASLINLSGQVLRTVSLSLTSGPQALEWKGLSDLPAGMYLVKVETETVQQVIRWAKP